MIPTLLGITLVVFAISRIAPGDPVSLAMGPGGMMDAQRAADVRATRMRLYGLDKPVHVQYAIWLGRVARLDFGDSIKHHRAVIDLIKERLPITLTLNLISFVLIYAVSIPMGILSAVGRKKFLDQASSVMLLMLWSLPSMWVGQMLIGYLCGPPLTGFRPRGLSSNDAGTFPFFRGWQTACGIWFCLFFA